MMTNGGREGRIFLSNRHTKNGLFFLHIFKYCIFVFKNKSSQKFLNTPRYDIIQLMHSFEVNIRICQPENSDVH